MNKYWQIKSLFCCTAANCGSQILLLSLKVLYMWSRCYCTKEGFVFVLRSDKFPPRATSPSINKQMGSCLLLLGQTSVTRGLTLREGRERGSPLAAASSSYWHSEVLYSHFTKGGDKATSLLSTTTEVPSPCGTTWGELRFAHATVPACVLPMTLGHPVWISPHLRHFYQVSNSKRSKQRSVFWKAKIFVALQNLWLLSILFLLSYSTCCVPNGVMGSVSDIHIHTHANTLRKIILMVIFGKGGKYFEYLQFSFWQRPSLDVNLNKSVAKGMAVYCYRGKKKLVLVSGCSSWKHSGNTACFVQLVYEDFSVSTEQH